MREGIWWLREGMRDMVVSWGFTGVHRTFQQSAHARTLTREYHNLLPLCVVFAPLTAIVTQFGLGAPQRRFLPPTSLPPQRHVVCTSYAVCLFRATAHNCVAVLYMSRVWSCRRVACGLVEELSPVL